MWLARVMLLAGVCTLALLGAHAAYSQVGKAKDLDRQQDEIVRDFVTRTHKLALQYEQAGEHDKAKNTLRLILQVHPDNEPAKTLLDKISKQELTENKKTLKILADKGWQKTGIQVQEGKPVSIEAKGDWVFRLHRVVTADGLEVPEDMKQFPIGSLIGYIEPSTPPVRGQRDSKKDAQAERPFLIGSSMVFTPQITGVLYLKMHDSDESDNSGQLTVVISGQVRER